MKWPENETVNLIYKSLLSRETTYRDQIVNDMLDTAREKEIYDVEQGKTAPVRLAYVDGKDQKHILNTIETVINDLKKDGYLTEDKLNHLSLTDDGKVFIEGILPENY